MSEFKPLDFGRHLDADDSLDVYEYAVLNALARGADNRTFKVRRSLGAIATMAKVKRHTVSEVLERPHVAKYLDKIERSPRRVDVWLRQAPYAVGRHMPCDDIGRGAAMSMPWGGHTYAVGRPPSALSPPSALTDQAPAESRVPQPSEEEIEANMASAPRFDDDEPGPLRTVSAGAQPPVPAPTPVPSGFGPESDPFRSSPARTPHPKETAYSRNAFERMAREEGFDPITGEYGNPE